ncbi:MAG: hypothetical protein LBJ95_02985 [Oscillospiraceae bacterium]|jgi:hypothetical protein|nr:hypothetical protein [Oscillospiraceae bacterium]
MLKIQTKEQLLSKTNLTNREIAELSLNELGQVNGGDVPTCPYCGGDMGFVPLVGPRPPCCGKGQCVMAAVREAYRLERRGNIEAARDLAGKIAALTGMGAAIPSPWTPALGAIAATVYTAGEFADMMPHPEYCNVC